MAAFVFSGKGKNKVAASAADGGSGDEPYTWVLCECGVRLWRRYADRLEMTFVPRAGQRASRDATGLVRKRTISVPVHGATGPSVTCEKCGRVNVSI